MDDIVATRTDTSLRLWHRFEAPPRRVFEAWTRPESLKLWWCPAGWHPAEIAVDLRVGGRYRFAMQRESGARVLTVHGRFLEIRPPEKLVYTWRWDGAFPDMPETRVTVEFCAVDGGTELALRQEPVNLRVCAQHLSGWLAACGRIARTLGDPLPQTRPADATLIGSLA